MGSVRIRFEVRTPDGVVHAADLRSPDVAKHQAKSLAPCEIVRIETDTERNRTRERVVEVVR